MPALSSAAHHTGVASPLSNVRHAAIAPMPYCGGIHFWNHFFGSTQEKDLGLHRTVAGHCCDGFGRIQRTDKRNPPRWTCHRPGLVFAGYVFDGAHLRATGSPLAQISRTRNIQERVDFGCGVLHVHSSPNSDFVFSGFIAGYASHEIFGRTCSSAFHRPDALGSAIFPGGRGCRPGGVFHSLRVAQSAFSMAFSCRSPFFEGARLDRKLTLPLHRRHTGARIYSRSAYAWIFAASHFRLLDFRHPSRDLGSLQFRSES